MMRWPAASTPGPEEYRRLIASVRAFVEQAVPRGASVVVVSRGDDDLLDLGGRRAGHFPQLPGGTYAGSHPADSRTAIAHLEELRRQGAAFLVLPSTAFWWLEHYAEFARHLEAHHRLIARDDAACLIFALSGAASSAAAHDSWLGHLRDLAARLLPPDVPLAVLVAAGEDVPALDANPVWPVTASELDRAASAGARFLFVSRAARVVPQGRLVMRQEHVGELYELTPATPRRRRWSPKGRHARHG
ncbi:MAG TPA: hypothetical protein VGJ70_04650 [Solirubrobacteraceae bacterium]